MVITVPLVNKEIPLPLVPLVPLVTISMLIPDVLLVYLPPRTTPISLYTSAFRKIHQVLYKIRSRNLVQTLSRRANLQIRLCPTGISRSVVFTTRVSTDPVSNIYYHIALTPTGSKIPSLGQATQKKKSLGF